MESEYLRLKELIEAKYGTNKVSHFASLVGVDRVTCNNHVSGSSQPKFDLLKRYAAELDVDVREMFKGTVQNCYLIYMDNPPQDNVLKPPKTK